MFTYRAIVVFTLSLVATTVFMVAPAAAVNVTNWGCAYDGGYYTSQFQAALNAGVPLEITGELRVGDVTINNRNVSISGGGVLIVGSEATPGTITVHNSGNIENVTIRALMRFSKTANMAGVTYRNNTFEWGCWFFTPGGNFNNFTFENNTFRNFNQAVYEYRAMFGGNADGLIVRDNLFDGTHYINGFASGTSAMIGLGSRNILLSGNTLKLNTHDGNRFYWGIVFGFYSVDTLIFPFHLTTFTSLGTIRNNRIINNTIIGGYAERIVMLDNGGGKDHGQITAINGTTITLQHNTNIPWAPAGHAVWANMDLAVLQGSNPGRTHRIASRPSINTVVLAEPPTYLSVGDLVAINAMAIENTLSGNKLQGESVKTGITFFGPAYRNVVERNEIHKDTTYYWGMGGGIRVTMLSSHIQFVGYHLIHDGEHDFFEGTWDPNVGISGTEMSANGYNTIKDNIFTGTGGSQLRVDVTITLMSGYGAPEDGEHSWASYDRRSSWVYPQLPKISGYGNRIIGNWSENVGEGASNAIADQRGVVYLANHLPATFDGAIDVLLGTGILDFAVESLAVRSGDTVEIFAGPEQDIYFSWDSENYDEYLGAIDLSTAPEGATTLYYYAEDAGYQEQPKTLNITRGLTVRDRLGTVLSQRDIRGNTITSRPIGQ